jgi:hypothetical protein
MSYLYTGRCIVNCESMSLTVWMMRQCRGCGILMCEKTMDRFLIPLRGLVKTGSDVSTKETHS